MGLVVSTTKHSEEAGAGAAIGISRGYLVSDGTGFKFSGTGPADAYLVSDGATGYEFDSGASSGDLRIMKNGTAYRVTP